ncbi:permease prefix domain 1-containing protein [Kribbella sp. CA-293567]|uniref:permease prefix domain 1-containing protein n=1 Tax=Kribbella sp. CA-293567 TaxID=3002436 RepID=UPI0022DDE09A|nr:permease prefix domain 1-containing protein [Kribbella sp. CA-293567]WBQ07978.1 permease prefix domain 1-containing protein [Kribbella sp. CA-293567]
MNGNTLTDRYVHEVVRRIPADQRDDVAEELRTTIADTAEARDGADPEVAERAVLTEMGDPIRLAAKYADRPLALIGPDLYPAYVRLLKLLLTTVLPIVVAVLVVLEVLDSNDFGAAIGSAIGGILTVGGQMIAWLTVVFALIDRSRHREAAAAEVDRWSPDDLPELRQTEKRESGVALSVAWNALLIALIVWQHTAEPYRAGNDRIEVLDPALWSGWIWPILAGLAGIVTLDVIRFATRGWTMLHAGLYAVAELTATLPLVWILSQQRLFNPAFLADFNNGWTSPDAVYTGAAIAVLLVSGSEILSRFREARKQS